jgi:hypothetical protein
MLKQNTAYKATQIIKDTLHKEYNTKKVQLCLQQAMGDLTVLLHGVLDGITRQWREINNNNNNNNSVALVRDRAKLVQTFVDRGCCMVSTANL